MRGPGSRLVMAGGLATFVVGVAHLQQYADFIKDVPTIGTLFLLNGLGAGLVCVMLATRLRLLAALGGVALSAGALISLAIARFAAGGLFDYVEPTLRRPVLVSVLAETAAVLCLGAYVVIRARASAGGVTRVGRPQGV